MAKQPAPLFPQRIEAVNVLRCTQVKDDVALLATDLGLLRVPLVWWRQHEKDASIVLVVAAVEAAPPRGVKPAIERSE